MKAEEIRNLPLPGAETKFDEKQHSLIAAQLSLAVCQNMMLREIAAQLADLNELFREMKAKDDER